MPAPGVTRPPGPRFLLDSVAGRDLLETRLGQLLEAYPEVDYVWLWEDEQHELGEPRKPPAGAKPQDLQLSVTPFVQAYEFLKRNAPKKRLVLSGWGGVARNFEIFHQKLPKDDRLRLPERFARLGPRQRGLRQSSKAASAGPFRGSKTTPACGCRSSM